jgi:hypothetical protein
LPNANGDIIQAIERIVMDNQSMEKFKPLLRDFIRFYYKELGCCTGGNLHIVLDDGNLSEQDIWYCQEEAQKAGDTFGYFLATLMRYFTEEELTEMYGADWLEYND